MMICFVMLFLLLALEANADPIDYNHPQNIRKFADHLYDQGDYLSAIGEYQRYLFSSPKDKNQILYRIGLSYRATGQISKAIDTFNWILKKQPSSQLAKTIYYQIAHSHFLANEYEKAIDFLGQTTDPLARQLTGINLLMLKRWNSALELFNQLDLENLPTDIRKSNANYQELAVRGKHLPRKSPILAGCLSTVIPGTGKIYNERLADAVNAMITIGLSSWLAYDGFKKNGPNSVKGWTFGVVACSFYLGNIYGAVIASQTHNQQIESKFLEQLRWDIGQ